MKTALTVGNFDGVHRGHRALVEAVTEWRRQQPHPQEYRTVVISFEPHPVEVLRPGTVVKKLTTTREKTHLLQNLGVDEVRILPFTPDFSQVQAREFFEEILIKGLNLAYMAVGHNFYFGHNREGTPGKLIDWCKAKGVGAHLVDPIEADGAPISSSRIRALIEEGQMIAANRLLGREYSLTGEVVHGDKRGRLLGFPTANLRPDADRCVPSNGVYLSESTVEGKTFPSITNVGIKPTVHVQGPLVVETHLFDFTGDLYGKQLTVEFRDRIRAERKFSSLDELREQIQKDTPACALARLDLVKHGPSLAALRVEGSMKIARRPSPARISVARAMAPAMAMMMALATCNNQPTTFVPNQTDSFEAHNGDNYKTPAALLQADYVFVMDYSYTMRLHREGVSQNLQSFANDLEDEGIDYRIGVVNGGIHADHTATFLDDFIGTALMKTGVGGLAQSLLATIDNLGKPLERNRPVMLEAARRVMAKKKNEFLRPAAQLVYVFVSDEDDWSNKPELKFQGGGAVSHYVDELLKPKIAPCYVSARSVTLGVAPGCALQKSYNKPGTRLAQAAEQLDQVAHDPLCLSKPWSETLRNVARDVTRPTRRFMLRERPVDGSIAIFENGAPYPEEDWYYDADTNEIHITGRDLLKDAAIRIDYQIAYALSKAPNPATIAVLVDGQLVSGWSYIEGENRISFDPGSIPAEGAEVKISYQVAGSVADFVSEEDAE